MSSTPDPTQQTQSLNDKSRSAARESLFLLGKLWLDSERSTDVRIRNLSATGMMAEIKEYTAVGDVIHIEIKGLGKLAGTIAWIAEKRIGIALQRKIDPSRARQQVRGSLHVPDHLKQQPPVRPGFKQV